MLDPAYRLWRIGKDRFAVIPTGQVTPVLGFVSRNAYGAWVVERQGKVLRALHASSEDAAAALIELERDGRS